MGNYKVLSDSSTLGPVGTIVTDAELVAQSLDADLLVASSIIEPTSKNQKDKE